MVLTRNLDILPGALDSKDVTTREAWLRCETCAVPTPHSYIGTQQEMRDLLLGTGAWFRGAVWAHRFICSCGATRVWGVA